MAKAKSGISGILPTKIAEVKIIPDNLRQFRFVFAGASGNGSSGGTYYTVPNARIFTIENIIKINDTNITATASTYLYIRAPSGSDILRSPASSNGGADPNSIIKQSLRLVAGHTINLAYQTSDSNGQFLWVLAGIEEADPFAYAGLKP